MKIDVEYLEDEELYDRVVGRELTRAEVSIDLATANLKTMMIEFPVGEGDFVSLPELLARKADDGVRVRLLHSAVPSEGFLQELRRTELWSNHNFTMRRCPRVHLKAMVIDGKGAYLGTANLTGAGLGAKADERRNFEVGLWTASTEMVRRLERFFLSIWEGALCEGCGRARDCPQPLEEPDFS